MSITPSILINGVTPRPDGTEVDSQFGLGASAISLALASAVGVTSIEWSITSKPTYSTTAIASATPAAPFSTTFGPLDDYGTYILKCVLNGDAASAKEVAVCVLTPYKSLRIPALAESNQWDNSEWWHTAMREMFLAEDGNRDGVASVAMPDADYTATVSEYKRRILYVTGALTASRDLILPHSGWWHVINATTGGWSLRVKGATGTSVSISAGSATVMSTGTNFVA